jgi:hypothetical protein
MNNKEILIESRVKKYRVFKAPTGCVGVCGIAALRESNHRGMFPELLRSRDGTLFGVRTPRGRDHHQFAARGYIQHLD